MGALKMLYDRIGTPFLQYLKRDGSGIEVVKGANGGVDVNALMVGGPTNINKAPVVGAKTVTTVAAELFAGASRLTNRGCMKVFNAGTITIYYGPSGVTVSTGFPILPGDYEIFLIDQTPLFFVASANNAVNVEER